MSEPQACRPEDLRTDALLGRLAGVARVVFDLDGTLYDTRDYERPALTAVAAWLRQRSGQPLDGLERALWERRETRRHEAGLFDEQLALHQLPPAWGPECARIFHDYPGTELSRSASLREILTQLRAQGARLALVTNGRERLQRRKLRQLGLEDAFDVRIYCEPDHPAQLKPSDWAWGQLHAWRGATRTAYVGDDPVDARFASAGDALFVKFLFRDPVHGN